MQIAVVGAGISGLSAAWLLSQHHDVTLFEKEPRLGGHSNTVEVPEGTTAEPARAVAVDTGFIVYNTGCYPNLIALFEHLGVPTAATDMSFSVSLDGGRYEYNGNGADGFFAQRSNLLSWRHWRMAREIGRFFQQASVLQNEASDPDVTLAQWLERHRYSRSFIDHHIVPMGAAIWSVPACEMLGFPAQSFARFFANHGLLQMHNRPQWRTVKGGSRAYVSRLIRAFRGEVSLGDGVAEVRRTQAGVEIRTRAGHTATFDRCVLACHADEALAFLPDASADERRVLGAFRYASNDTLLHTDARLMPARAKVWTSWNYLGTTAGDDAPRATAVTYWMNKLQPLETSRNYFVSLNPRRTVAPDKIIARFSYQHPLFDRAALKAQEHLWPLQGCNNTWFAGSYFGYGFHEDALQSGLAAAEHMTARAGAAAVRRPWRVDNESSRLKLGVPLSPFTQVAAQ